MFDDKLQKRDVAVVFIVGGSDGRLNLLVVCNFAPRLGADFATVVLCGHAMFFHYRL